VIRVNSLLQKCGTESDFKEQYAYLRKFLMSSSENTELRDLARLFVVPVIDSRYQCLLS